jgi:secreted Zn-dependent insulinase-like peptidase
MRAFFFGLWFIASLATADVVAPELSDRKYRSFELDNALKVLVISDPTTDKAAASLDVYVGSNNDPEGFPGLAHFLEHMLFLGTDQFPEAGEYQQYISTQGGSHNAYTAPEHTNYFFDVDPKGLAGALDRFSRFFIAPTMDPQYVEREVNAVHSEYQSKLKDAARQSFEATKQGLNQAHPFSQFRAGNLDTLNRPGLLEALNTFYETEYSANRMALVVLGAEPLDTLERMVRNRFAEIPNRQLPPSTLSTPLFDMDRMPLVVQSKPASESRRLTLLWPVPDTDAFQGQAPLRYLGHLLGHEGEGSLLQTLKDRGLANSLSAGESLGMAERRSFSVSVSLTPAGFEARDQIVKEIYKAITTIETAGISDWRFDELKTIAEANFRFAEEANARSLVTRFADQLHTTPADELYTRGRLYTSFDAQLIRDMLTWLTPERMLMRVTAPEVNPEYTTPYYPTEVRVFPLQADRLDGFVNARRTPSDRIALPKPNPFIQDPGDPLPQTRIATSDTRPQQLLNTDAVDGYVLPEERFGQPRSDLYIRLRSPLASDSPETRILSDLMASTINEHFNTVSYEAVLAGAGFGAQATQSGITLEFSGFHAALIPLVDEIMAALPIPLVDEATWARLYQLKQQELGALDTTRPFNRLFDELTAGLMPRAYPKTELVDVLDEIGRSTFHQYQQAFFNGVRAELFLHGPVTEEDGAQLLQSIADRLPVDPATTEVTIQTEPWTGPRTRTFEYPHPDQAAVVAFIDTDDSAPARVLNALAGNLLEAPFYTRLRTEQQLGYITFATAFPLVNTPVLTGVVQSPVADPDVLAEAILGEFDQFADAVASMNPDQFEEARLSMLNELNNPPQTQAELSNSIWQAIGLRRPFTDRVQRTEVLKQITQAEFVDYLRKRLDNPVVLKAYRSDVAAR